MTDKRKPTPTAVFPRTIRGIAAAAAAMLLATSAMLPAVRAQAPADAPKPTAPLRAMIVGGGPTLDHNQAAIESNVRYVTRLLPPGTPTRTLFTDGDKGTQSVLCLDKDGKQYYRAPELPAIDGPSQLMDFQYHVETLSAPDDKNAVGPLLLYFTGHGSPGRGGGGQQDFAANRYDMWGGEEMTVQRLATEIESLPATVPVTVIMCQCFSGAFGNLLFASGAPDGPPVDRPICGFFASIAQRPAAGCTPEINEANYKDFTGYFFAALTGIDRLGKPVTGADYNKDGKVGMDEAFAYTLINDDSIDTPVCTSDVFLRRFVPTKDDAPLYQVKFGDVRSWATPAQRAALDGLSQYLNLTGDDRDARAYTFFTTMNVSSFKPYDTHMLRFVRLIKTVSLAHQLDRSSDKDTKKRYAALVRAEAGNPLGALNGKAAQAAATALAAEAPRAAVAAAAAPARASAL